IRINHRPIEPVERHMFPAVLRQADAGRRMDDGAGALGEQPESSNREFDSVVRTEPGLPLKPRYPLAAVRSIGTGGAKFMHGSFLDPEPGPSAVPEKEINW